MGWGWIKSGWHKASSVFHKIEHKAESVVKVPLHWAHTAVNDVKKVEHALVKEGKLVVNSANQAIKGVGKGIGGLGEMLPILAIGGGALLLIMAKNNRL